MIWRWTARNMFEAVWSWQVVCVTRRRIYLKIVIAIFLGQDVVKNIDLSKNNNNDKSVLFSFFLFPPPHLWRIRIYFKFLYCPVDRASTPEPVLRYTFTIAIGRIAFPVGNSTDSPFIVRLTVVVRQNNTFLNTVRMHARNNIIV